MIYLAPNHAPTSRQHFGLLISLNSQRDIKGKEWAMDNGRFAKNGVNQSWTESKWLAMLERYKQHVETCLFCVVPDVPFSAAETLALFPQYAEVVRGFGYPVAICTQDGMTPNDIPWPQIDAVFIGGSDAHKLGMEAIEILNEAKRRGKWTHVGRVNSAKRICQFWYADSVDGTQPAIDKSRRRLENLRHAVGMAQSKKMMRKLL